jgi:hypothetical protein
VETRWIVRADSVRGRPTVDAPPLVRGVLFRLP